MTAIALRAEARMNFASDTTSERALAPEVRTATEARTNLASETTPERALAHDVRAMTAEGGGR